MKEEQKKRREYTPEELDLLNGPVNDAIAKLERLPDILEMGVQDFNLDMAEWTPQESIINGRRHNMIYNLIELVRDNIYDVLDILNKAGEDV